MYLTEKLNEQQFLRTFLISLFFLGQGSLDYLKGSVLQLLLQNLHRDLKFDLQFQFSFFFTLSFLSYLQFLNLIQIHNEFIHIFLN